MAPLAVGFRSTYWLTNSSTATLALMLSDRVLRLELASARAMPWQDQHSTPEDHAASESVCLPRSPGHTSRMVWRVNGRSSKDPSARGERWWLSSKYHTWH